MELNIKIRVRGAAFEEMGPSVELARILRHLAQRMEDGHTDAGTIMDNNGNKVGQYRMKDTEGDA